MPAAPKRKKPARAGGKIKPPDKQEKGKPKVRAVARRKRTGRHRAPERKIKPPD